MLPFSELIEWNSAANFLADHLNYDLLEPPYELVCYRKINYSFCLKLFSQPKTLWSPTKILADQHGNCFDYANLLCSLLIGAGYDAYIVSGYATREICYLDTTRLQNPYIRKRLEVYFILTFFLKQIMN
jgi:transglutaminase-like putative cysteine protease